MDVNSNESCKEATHGGVRLKFVKIHVTKQGKQLDPIWSQFLRSEIKSEHNRYIALCMYCDKTFSGRLHSMRKHITYQCDMISSEQRANFIKSMDSAAASNHLPVAEKRSSDGSIALFSPKKTKTEMKVNKEEDEQTRTQKKREHKFCIFCGTKLPIVAKFCSSCGESQIIEEVYL